MEKIPEVPDGHFEGDEGVAVVQKGAVIVKQFAPKNKFHVICWFYFQSCLQEGVDPKVE